MSTDARTLSARHIWTTVHDVPGREARTYHVKLGIGGGGMRMSLSMRS